MVTVVLDFQLAAPLTFQMFATPSPFQVRFRGVMTMVALGVALASEVNWGPDRGKVGPGDDVIIRRVVGVARPVLV